MKINKKGETIVSIIIVVVIISVVIISLIKIIEYDEKLNFEYSKINYTSVIEKNTISLLKGINTSNFLENEVFYIYKTGSIIETFSGTENEDYKYINYLGEYVNTGSYMGAIYTRQCLIEKDSDEGQMIKCSIKELIKK